MMGYHTPVLLKEVLTLLNVHSNINVVDCTLGDGGHAIEILKHIAPHGKVLGVDEDKEAIERSESRITKHELRKNLLFVNDNFSNLKQIVENYEFSPVHAVLLDLGISSYQLDEGERGFSFLKDTHLYMTFHGTKEGKTAMEVINTYSKQKLKEIFQKYGEIKNAGAIAHKIIRLRKREPIVKSSMLVKAILPNVGSRHALTLRKPHIKLLAKVWQAIRIEVNDELGNLKAVLPQIVEILEPYGRIAIISYHSLEDRIVKHFFKKQANPCECPVELPQCMCGEKPQLRIITKHVVRPLSHEIKHNSRARSAKLRVAEKM